MVILIDGYNVLKMIFPHAQVDERERERFIMQIARYARLSGNSPFIIFDGGDEVRPVFFNRNGIVVVYSGYHDSADTVIKGLLEEEQRSDVLLVSTDRELNRYAENFDIPSMDSVVFYGYVRDRLSQEQGGAQKNSPGRPMQGALKKFESPHSTGQKNSNELDALMEAASRNVMYKDEDADRADDRHRPHTKKRVSKLDKRLERLVKKL